MPQWYDRCYGLSQCMHFLYSRSTEAQTHREVQKNTLKWTLKHIKATMPILPPLMSHCSVSGPGGEEQNHSAIAHILYSEFNLSSMSGIQYIKVV